MWLYFAALRVDLDSIAWELLHVTVNYGRMKNREQEVTATGPTN